MKLKLEFVMTEIDDQITAVPVGDGSEQFCGVLQINKEAKIIMELLQQDTTEEEIVKSIKAQYEGSSVEEISAFVHDCIETLSAAGIVG